MRGSVSLVPKSFVSPDHEPGHSTAQHAQQAAVSGPVSLALKPLPLTNRLKLHCTRAWAQHTAQQAAVRGMAWPCTSQVNPPPGPSLHLRAPPWQN